MQRRGGARMPTELIFSAVLEELSATDETWQGRSLGSPEPRLQGTTLSLSHVFNLLGLVLERETVRASLASLQSASENARGTSLEYLENALPEAVRTALWPRLSELRKRQAGEPGEALRSGKR